MCERKPTWAKNNCKKSCGLCNPAPTVPPTGSCVGSSLNFNDYFGWQNHMDYLECLQRRYSDRCETIDIGNSVEGRAIKVIKISQPSTNNKTKPAIWIDGGIHAREWISPSSVEYFVYQLVENFKLPENKKMVDNFDIYVAPILNPDGYVQFWIIVTKYNVILIEFRLLILISLYYFQV